MAATARKLFVEVVEARDLLPKDGMGTSSPYVVADFDGQRRRTQTICRNLNPTWNELLEFNVSSSAKITGEPLEVDVFHDQRVGPSRRNNFLGRVRLDFRQFVRKGEEALIHFPLEKKSFFSWVRGDIGLRIYYDDMSVASSMAAAMKEDNPTGEAEVPPTDDDATAEKSPAAEKAADPVDAAKLEAKAPPEKETNCENLPEQETEPPSTETETQGPAAPQKEAAASPPPPLPVEAVPKLPSKPPVPEPVERSSYDLVDKMQYVFIRVVRARSLPGNAKPHVRVAANGRQTATCTARRSAFFEWDQTFAFARDPASSDSNLEISVWDHPPDAFVGDDDRYFLGGVCFDVSELPVRDLPDGPLAPQWYRLEGSGAARGGDIMLATWVGTQADESFAEAWKADAASTSRSKIYLSPKLWYLRVTLIEAQEISTPTREISLFIRATLGFQVLKTRAAFPRNGAPAWNEDLLFVTAEPFSEEESLVLYLESRQGKEVAILGSAAIPLSSVERRVDDRKVASRWLDLPSTATGCGRRLFGVRLHVRICLDGGYHVQDEQTHATSDNRPSARQLWRPAVGTIDIGVIGCRGLLPMKAVDGKGTTDAFAVAKYGPKWARTRTVADSFDPAWNEQFNWPVFDTATVLTIVVFDDVTGGSKESTANCRPLGRIRIRISTLETNRSYRCFYPLLLLLPSGLKRTGEIEIAMRFTRTVSQFDLLHVYTLPILPAMHHIRPIGYPQRESLRIAAARVSAAHLARAEPSLRREVVMWTLEASDPVFSMRRVRANWGRIAAAMSWVGDGVRWMSEIREWRNPTATIMAHVAILLLMWFPDMIVPAVAVHLGLVGIWRYRRRPKVPAAGLAARESEAEGAEREELDEEFDAVPSVKGEETVRARYERMRAVGTRLQAMLGDAAAQAERVQALLSWRDPGATAVFVAGCFVLAVVMYVMPARMVAVLAAFYFMRHPVFRGPMPPPATNFFRRLPSLAERII
ncbi:protein QUIRKY-like [Dendrobium catenatum]|uniref:Synaptotagmin-4 n=1 Tax=Dendrobium catenatum TaxID=906689 RepID=A0A2I0W1V6_9ASPA|nr:protein QUIRKY-like [Dendrobium catenatum]PKU69653.1 Synaptotagmin-4 [Dendrobium catenatum]